MASIVFRRLSDKDRDFVDRLREQLSLSSGYPGENEFLLSKIEAALAWIVSYCGISEMPDVLPPALEEAVVQLAAHLWTHRGDGDELLNVPAIVRSLVAPYYEWPI